MEWTEESERTISGSKQVSKIVGTEVAALGVSDTIG